MRTYLYLHLGELSAGVVLVKAATATATVKTIAALRLIGRLRFGPTPC